MAAPETSDDTGGGHGGARPPAVPRSLDVAAAWSWRLIAIGIAVLGLALLADRLRIVLLPLVVAVLLSNLLLPVRRVLGRRLPSPLAMLGTVGTFFGGIALLGLLIVPPLAEEFSDLDETLDEALAEIEDWLVDGPLALEEDTITEARERLVEGVGDLLDREGAVADGVALVGEILAGGLLALVVTFFVVKDAEELQDFALRNLPDRTHDRVRAASRGAWTAIGGYLRGAAALGVVEGVIIGIALLVVGAELVLPVASLTFIAAFVPFVGAIAAGVVAVAVALVTAGPGAAGVIAVVAIAVQQFDNDLLAPVIYGKALSLHPLAVIVAVATGAALLGLVGAFLAVPVVAVVAKAVTEVRALDATGDGDEAAQDAATDSSR